MRQMSVPLSSPLEPLSSPVEQCVVIVGVGLIGGSLAAALRHRRVVQRVIGVGRQTARLAAARDAGLIDDFSIDLAQAVAEADIVVFCTPVDRVVEGVREAALVARPETVLTDAGSVKGPICDALSGIPCFIGAHPIAGSHRQGYEAADPHLFEGRLCVLTPGPTSGPGMLERVDRLWRRVGMRTCRMSPEGHDQALAMTSHLPHVVAAALARTLTVENAGFTGSGFRDTTRVASGDPALWTAILRQNVKSVREGIAAAQQSLAAFDRALANGDDNALVELLMEGQRARQRLDQD